MKLIIDTPNKELNKAIEDKVRDELRSTPQSNPKDDENDIRMDNLKDMFYTDTIMDSMNRIMQLVKENKKIRSDK